MKFRVFFADVAKRWELPGSSDGKVQGKVIVSDASLRLESATHHLGAKIVFLSLHYDECHLLRLLVNKIGVDCIICIVFGGQLRSPLKEDAVETWDKVTW